MPEIADSPPNIEETRGNGGLGTNEFQVQNDARLIERAIRAGWKIPETTLEETPKVMQEIVASPKSNRRNKIAATRALIAMGSSNLRDIHHVEKLEAEAGIIRLKMQRAEEGKPNDSVAIVVPVKNQLPLPEYLRDRSGLKTHQNG